MGVKKIRGKKPLGTIQGRRVLATAGSDAKCRFGRQVPVRTPSAGSGAKCGARVECGAELAVNYRTEEFVGAVRRFSQGR